MVVKLNAAAGGLRGMYLVCCNVWLGGTCKTNICMNARTQSFPAEHYPEQHMAAAGLSFSLSASWSHLLPFQMTLMHLTGRQLCSHMHVVIAFYYTQH